ELEPRRGLNEGAQLDRKVAAAGDQLGAPVAPEGLERRLGGGAAPGAARLDRILVEVGAGRRRRGEVEGAAGKRLVVQLGVAQEREADSVGQVQPLVAVD